MQLTQIASFSDINDTSNSCKLTKEQRSKQRIKMRTMPRKDSRTSETRLPTRETKLRQWKTTMFWESFNHRIKNLNQHPKLSNWPRQILIKMSHSILKSSSHLLNPRRIREINVRQKNQLGQRQGNRWLRRRKRKLMIWLNLHMSWIMRNILRIWR